MTRRAGWSAAVHRRLPAASVGWRSRLMAAVDARNPRKLQRARSSMRLLLEQARPDADLDTLARRYLELVRVQHEIRWHPELCGPRPVEGLELLTNSRGGVLVHLVHHGPFLQIGPSVAQSGREVHVMADRGLCAADRTPWQAQSHAVASRDCQLFSAEEGTAGIRDRLTRGLVVVVATDVPGHTPVEFLGQRLVGSSGAIRATHEVGAPVLSATVHRDPAGETFFKLSEPLHPLAFERCEDLLQALLQRQEESVLAWPEAYYDPLTKWHRAAEPSVA